MTPEDTVTSWDVRLMALVTSLAVGLFALHALQSFIEGDRITPL